MLSERLKEDAEMLKNLEINENFLVDGARISTEDVVGILKRLSLRVFLEGKVYYRFGDVDDVSDAPLPDT